MSKIYITGHRHPDLDSVCSAIAYAELKNKLDSDNEYIAVRCGNLSESSKSILDAVGITPPELMPNVYPKVSDVMLTSDRRIDIKDPLTVIARTYSDENPSAVPVFDKDEFVGLLSIDDITAWLMKELQRGDGLKDTPTVGMVMREQKTPLQVSDLFEEAKQALSVSSNRGLSVFDGDRFVGYVTRRCFLRAPQYNVIMVDHNEPKQSIKGIENANLLEIVDHHRLDALKTNLPIFVDSEPLGSTCTIVYQLYLRNRIIPEPYIARVLLTGMMSDTLVLKSPTTTWADVAAAGALSVICGVEVEEFGHSMFSHIESLSKINPETAIMSDFKRYEEKGVKIGIGQCETTTLHDIEDYRESFLTALEEVRKRKGLDWAVCMVTDVLSEHSVLLSTSFPVMRNLQYAAIGEQMLDMPGVMSRKKQLLPEIIFALGN